MSGRAAHRAERAGALAQVGQGWDERPPLIAQTVQACWRRWGRPVPLTAVCAWVLAQVTRGQASGQAGCHQVCRQWCGIAS
mgnify:CR=1 FL=1|jgi:hypothetical protein